MKKQIIWSAVITSAIGLINLVVYTILACLDIVEMRFISYLFLLGLFVSAWLPLLVSFIFKLNFNFVALISYHVFLVLAIVIGSLWRVYSYWEYYDVVIHFSSGVLISLITYSIFIANKNNKVGLVWLFIIIFSVAMMFGGVWEIWEFVTDAMFGNNGQNWQGFVGRGALMDTMYDLICDCCGGILGSTIAIFMEYRKRHGTSKVVENKVSEDAIVEETLPETDNKN